MDVAGGHGTLLPCPRSQCQKLGSGILCLLSFCGGGGGGGGGGGEGGWFQNALGYVSVCILRWSHPQLELLLELTDLGTDSPCHDTFCILLLIFFFFSTREGLTCNVILYTCSNVSNEGGGGRERSDGRKKR